MALLARAELGELDDAGRGTADPPGYEVLRGFADTVHDSQSAFRAVLHAMAI